MNLQQDDEKYLWHPFTPFGSVVPLAVTRAEGSLLYTEDGNQIIDAIGSWWVSIHGHCHPFIMDAIKTQADTLDQVIFAGFTHQPAVELGKLLVEHLFKGEGKCFYSDNGSTAIEVGLKMALQYFDNQGIERKKVIALEGAYHGDTFGAMSVAERSPFTKAFDDKLFDVDFLNFLPCCNINEPLGSADYQTIEDFKSLLTQQPAAFIFEPLVQGASGFRLMKIALLNSLIELAQSAGVITIADEVMTGFGRTGAMFASDLLSHKPDIVCLSKGLSGGVLPLGATICKNHIFDAYKTSELKKTFFHGHSYTANPMACAAGVASFKLMNSEETCTNLKRINDANLKFAERLKQFDSATNIRVLGPILAFDFANETETGYFNEARSKLYPFFLERGVLMRPLGNVIYLLPPYTISNQHLEHVYSVIEELLSTSMVAKT